MMQSYDVVIAGGGIIGLTLACALRGSGLRIAVVEPRPPMQDDNDSATSQHKLRVSALNSASERLLQKIGVWQGEYAGRATPYQSMEVWEKDSFARLSFQAEQYGYQQLGYIVENHLLQQQLWQQAIKSKEITLLAPGKIKQVTWGENDVFITLEDGDVLTARLVVGADGAHSWLRQQADIPLTFKDYNHHALVASITTELPHEQCARQVFHSDGILAFLPLYQPNLSSIVWSLPPERAQRLQQCDATQFERELSVAFDMRLGQCQLVSDRLTVPLTARYARNFARHRLVLVGDAAHTIHPLAGQGANLGLMDVAELVAELTRLYREDKDIGEYRYLRRYERRRKYQAAKMLAAMQGLHDLFAGDQEAKKWIRSAGLALAGKLPGLKALFVRQASGLDDLPDWVN